jgi:hypothetical protein
VSDQEGIVTILKKELEADVQANHDSGVMDFAYVGNCFPSVEIKPLSVEDIDGAIKARGIWKNLLAGERYRWISMEQLLNVYRNANNQELIPLQSQPIRAQWDKAGTEYSYSFMVVPR